MNRRSKGRMAEKEYKQLLEASGWVVEQTKGALRFNPSGVDFFGHFDLIAFHPQVSRWMLVQVKCNQSRNCMPAIKGWCEKNIPPVTDAVVAIRKDFCPPEKRWKLITVFRSGMTTSGGENDDGRESDCRTH